MQESFNESDCVQLPKLFRSIKPGKTRLEVTTSPLSQKLQLPRQDLTIGFKILIYAQGSERRKELDAVREVTEKFFTKELGFDFCVRLDLDEVPIVSYVVADRKFVLSAFAD